MDHLFLQVAPLASVSIDEYTVAGGSQLLLLRHLVMVKTAGGSVEDALRDAYPARLPHQPPLPDPELLDLALFESLIPPDAGRGAPQTKRLVGLSHAYELPLYKAILQPELEAITASGDPPLNIVPEARRLVELLAPFRPLPLEYVPGQSLVRAFCGGAWHPV